MTHDPDELVVARPEGLYCPAGDFHIDPWQPVDTALITHAHGDHLRAGHARYVAAQAGAAVIRARMGDVTFQGVPYGEEITHRGVRVSFHPAGHVLGSAQIRLEHAGRVWVVSGDYKLGADPTCAPFEPVRCDVFITESTFGLPVFRWEPGQRLREELNAWWQSNAADGQCSVAYAYAFGKAQRLLHGLDTSIGPVVVHGAVARIDAAYRQSGVALPPTASVLETPAEALRRALVIAPPSAQGSTWLRRFGAYRDAYVSGWMQLRGMRRRRNVDRGFVLSDHADWPGLLQAIEATGAGRVIVTHGYVEPLVRFLGERGLDAGAFRTEFGDEHEERREAEDADDEMPAEPAA